MDRDKQLFRARVSTSTSESEPAPVAAIVPPSGTVGTAIALATVAVVTAIAFIVRMPLKTEAAGVLMPEGGLVDVIAAADGRIERVHQPALAVVKAGARLFDVAVQSAVVDGVTSSHFRLQSSRREVDQVKRIRVARRNALKDQLNGYQQELDAVDERRQLVIRQRAIQQAALAKAEGRLENYWSLADKGHLSRDDVNRQREQLLRDQAALAGIDQQAAALAVDRQSLLTRIVALRHEVEVADAEFDLRLEQLSRDVEASASRTRYSIRSPQAGVIETLLVANGSFVRKGQVLARLSIEAAQLEAWLYLPSSSARSIAPGQSVELLLDAWPRSRFGTRSATVYFVSSIPMSPEDVSAPLPVAVPVFEIRARLDRQPAPAADGRWIIPPGTTFRAFVLQRQMRLYEWLFKNRGPTTG